MPEILLSKPPVTGAPNFRKFIIRWNNNYPWDYQWRKKHNIPFGSPAHLSTSFPAMKFDLREEQIYNNEVTRQQNRHRAADTPILANYLLVPSKHTKADFEVSDEEYDNLDLSQFNDVSTT